MTLITTHDRQTRQRYLDQYTVRDGRIRNPGRFEGEMIYVPYYWDCYLTGGGADRDDGTMLGFDITAEDRAIFPELGRRRRTVRLYQREDGFVVEI